jgi:Flp pilus assembly protein TadG
MRVLLKRWIQNQSAVAAVEFALIVPVMLSMYLFSVDATNAYIATQRVSSVAATLSDLVSRSKAVISHSQLDDYFKAAELIMTPFKTETMTQVVSELSVDRDGNVKVVWTKSFPEGYSPYYPGDTFPANKAAQAAKLFELYKGTGTDFGYIIVGETSYKYTPVTNYIFNATIPINKASFYVPRYNRAIIYDPDT